jgi:hypothetical protein
MGQVVPNDVGGRYELTEQGPASGILARFGD